MKTPHTIILILIVACLSGCGTGGDYKSIPDGVGIHKSAFQTNDFRYLILGNELEIAGRRQQLNRVMSQDRNNPEEEGHQYLCIVLIGEEYFSGMLIYEQLLLTPNVSGKQDEERKCVFLQAADWEKVEVLLSLIMQKGEFPEWDNSTTEEWTLLSYWNGTSWQQHASFAPWYVSSDDTTVTDSKTRLSSNYARLLLLVQELLTGTEEWSRTPNLIKNEKKQK